MSAVEVLPSRGDSSGFHQVVGWAGSSGGRAWREAFLALLEGVDGLTTEQARVVLDSGVGRILGEAVMGQRPNSGAATVRRVVLDHLALPEVMQNLRSTLNGSKPFNVLNRRVIEDPPADPVVATLSVIARQHLGFETLRRRRSDRLDRREVGVDAIQVALRAAYEAGRASGS
jgi:hypothetical protein